MPRAAPLLPPSLLTPRAVRLASSSVAPHRVGTMRWHAHARHVALSSTTPCLAHYSDADVRTKLLRHRPHANPLPLSASLHACSRACALALSEHGRALAATPSHPIGPGARSYKRGPSRSFCLCPHRCLPLVSHHRLCFPLLHRCQAISPHLSPRPQVLELRRAPELLPDQLKPLILCR
jgi:hypothetical protein